MPYGRTKRVRFLLRDAQTCKQDIAVKVFRHARCIDRDVYYMRGILRTMCRERATAEGATRACLNQEIRALGKLLGVMKRVASAAHDEAPIIADVLGYRARGMDGDGDGGDNDSDRESNESASV